MQARSHLEAYAEVRALERCASGRPRAESRDRFVERHERPCAGAIRRNVDSAEQAVRGADLVVLATSSPTPVIEAQLGLDGRARRLGRRVPARSARNGAGPRRAAAGCSSIRSAAALVESGDVVHRASRRGGSTESTCWASSARSCSAASTGARATSEITIFKSLGMAVEDVVTADLVFRRALETGAGTELTL